MAEVLKIVVLGRACKKHVQISRTVSRSADMYVKAAFELPEFFVEIIEDELNVKKVSFIEDVSAFTSYSFKPQLQYRRTEIW